MAALTCYTCRIKFNEQEEHREHYRSDLHRFNLKRKVAGYPPVTAEIFNAKVAASKSEKESQATVKGKQHLKKDKKRRSALSQSTGSEESAFAEEHSLTEEELYQKRFRESKPLSTKDCLFDTHRARTFDANLRYMTKEYSFFIPEIEFIKDLKGLLKYLGQKIVVGRTCIFCDKSLSSLEAVRSHMRDMNHTMIRWDDNEKEYEDFYDWSNDTRFVVEEDEEGNILPENTYISESHELVLADGKKVGHRALKKYYDQRASTQVQLISSLMQEHHRLEAIQLAKQKNMDVKSQQRIMKIQNKAAYQANNQKHFRLQNPM